MQALIFIMYHFIILFSCLSLGTAMVISPVFEQKLISMVETSMKCRHIAGMTLAIVKGM